VEAWSSTVRPGQAVSRIFLSLHLGALAETCYSSSFPCALGKTHQGSHYSVGMDRGLGLDQVYKLNLRHGHFCAPCALLYMCFRIWSMAAFSLQLGRKVTGNAQSPHWPVHPKAVGITKNISQLQTTHWLRSLYKWCFTLTPLCPHLSLLCFMTLRFGGTLWVGVQEPE
jgi:hypothetical protein